MATVDEAARHRLYDALGSVIGQDEAGTLMQLLPKSDWDEIVTKPYLDARLAEVRTELHTEIAGVRVQLHDALRTQLVWFIATMIAVVGILIAAMAALR